MLACLALALAISNRTEERATAPLPREKQVLRGVYTRPTVYVGEVMAVTKDSVTIRGRDECDKDGPAVIRTFKAAKHLSKGEEDPRETSNSNYRLIDVKIGDLVITKLREDGDDDLCLTISIRRRPGGMVPPAPFEKADVQHKYHIDANAYQEHEERGVPLPLRLDENYQRAVSEQFAREYIQNRKKRERIAPPPRPLERKK